jgi:hypothetical protein
MRLFCRCVVTTAIPIVVQCGLIGYDAITMVTIDKIPNDTDEATEQVYLKLLREAPPWRKAAMITSLTRACQELAVAGIRMRHPNESEQEIRMRLAALWLDRELLMRVFHWDPAHEGY